MTNTGLYSCTYKGNWQEFLDSFREACDILKYDVDNVEISSDGDEHTVFFTVTMFVGDLDDSAVDDVFEDVRQNFELETGYYVVLDDILIDD